MKKLLLRLTHRLWNREISRILNTEYSLGLIDSRQLHILLSRFDPTQSHCRVGMTYGRPAYGAPEKQA